MKFSELMSEYRKLDPKSKRDLWILVGLRMGIFAIIPTLSYLWVFLNYLLPSLGQSVIKPVNDGTALIILSGSLLPLWIIHNIMKRFEGWFLPKFIKRFNLSNP